MRHSEISLEKLPDAFRGNPLAYDYTVDFSRVAEFYDYAPTAAGVESRLAELGAREFPRAALCELLLHKHTQFTRNPLSLSAIESLRDRDAVVIATGQQAGVLGGPLLTIYKALHAVKYAQALARRTGRPVVPVFWIASEDHDLAEIDHVAAQLGDGSLAAWRTDIGPARSPAEYARFADGGKPILEALEREFSDNDFKRDILVRCQSSFTFPVGMAFRQWMCWLFKNTPLIFADPFTLRPLMTEVLREEIRHPSRNAGLIRGQSERLAALGYEPQVQLAGDCNLFYIDNGARRRIDWDGSVYRLRDSERRWSPTELEALLRGEFPNFSVNVALRTVAMESCLPCAAVVLGPAEIAYWGQFKSLFAAYGRRMPPLLPRASVTLLEGKIRKRLERWGLDLTVLRELPRLTDRLLREQAQGTLREARDVEATLRGGLADLGRLAAGVDPALKKWADKSLGDMGAMLTRFMDRLRREQDLRGENIGKDVALIQNALFPSGQPQERVHSIVPYLLRHGPYLLSEIQEHMNIETVNHQVIEL